MMQFVLLVLRMLLLQELLKALRQVHAGQIHFLVLSLLAEGSAWITGQRIEASGGMGL